MLWTKSAQLLSFRLLLHFWHFIECQFSCVRWRCLVFSLFFFALMSIISLFFYIENCYLAPLLCIVCALCVCLFSKCCFKGLSSLSSIESKSLTLTKFALDVNFKIITFHTILFLGFEAWISYLCHEMVLPYAPNVGCLAWLTLMGKKHLAPYLTEHNGHLGWKI
jgi:hypothetical protein